jgi:hypothetical protein
MIGTLHFVATTDWVAILPAVVWIRDSTALRGKTCRLADTALRASDPVLSHPASFTRTGDDSLKKMLFDTTEGKR